MNTYNVWYGRTEDKKRIKNVKSFTLREGTYMKIIFGKKVKGDLQNILI